MYCVDTPATRDQNRLLPIRDVYGCTQLPDLDDQALLENVVGENEITDVIDMTNTSCKTLEDEVAPVTNLQEGVRVFTPIFTTPLDIRGFKSQMTQTLSPILPGIVYPFELSEYRFPCDFASYLFWQNYKAAQLQLNCQEMGIHNGQDLLEISSASDVANYLTDLVAPDPDHQTTSSSSSESDADHEHQ